MGPASGELGAARASLKNGPRRRKHAHPGRARRLAIDGREEQVPVAGGAEIEAAAVLHGNVIVLSRPSPRPSPLAGGGGCLAQGFACGAPPPAEPLHLPKPLPHSPSFD